MMLDVYENRRRRGLKHDKVVRATLLLCDIVRRRLRRCRAMPRMWLGGVDCCELDSGEVRFVNYHIMTSEEKRLSEMRADGGAGSEVDWWVMRQTLVGPRSYAY